MSVLVMKASQLRLHIEIKAVYSEICTKVISALCYQKVRLLIVKLNGQQTNQLALNG